METTKELITQLEQSLVEAIKDNDVRFLDQALHDDLLFIAPNGQLITKVMDLDSHRAGEMIVEQITVTIEDISIIDDTAIVVIVYDTKGTMLGKPIEGKFKYIRVWKRFAEGFKVVGGSCLRLETEA